MTALWGLLARILAAVNPRPGYPYQSEPGNVTVLGPETFIDPMGAVICHRGENYYRTERETP